MIAIKYAFETIKYDDNLPVKIELTDARGGDCRKEPHWHKEIELLYVLDGALTVTKGFEETALQAGDLSLVNAGEIHQISARAPDERVQLLSVYLSYEFAKRFEGALDAIYFRVDSGSAAEAALQDQLRQLAQLKQDTAQKYPGIKQYAVVMDILHILFENCCRQKQISLYGNCKVGFRNAKLAMEYIEENYRAELNLNVMAALVGLNPVYFSKYFKDSTGMGFNTYVNNVRLKHALEDLIDKGLSTADAAKYNGFPNVKSFETACKRSYGLTPLQFKKQQLKVS